MLGRSFAQKVLVIVTNGVQDSDATAAAAARAALPAGTVLMFVTVGDRTFLCLCVFRFSRDLIS